MGLLDGLIGDVLGSKLSGNRRQDPLGSVLGGLAGGSQAQGGNLLLQVVLSLLQQNGGLEGVLGRFRQGGLGQQADSWVGTGQNMNISPDQPQQIFGSSTIRIWRPSLVCRKRRQVRRWRSYYPRSLTS